MERTALSSTADLDQDAVTSEFENYDFYRKRPDFAALQPRKGTWIKHALEKKRTTLECKESSNEMLRARVRGHFKVRFTDLSRKLQGHSMRANSYTECRGSPAPSRKC